MDNWTMIVDFILIAGMSLLFLLIIVALKSNEGFSRKLLVVFFASSIFFLLYYYGYLHKSRILGGIAIALGNGAGFLLGPVLLFYIRSLIVPKYKIAIHLLRHLIPFFIFWVLISLPVALSMLFNLFVDYHKAYVKIADYINLIENLYFLAYCFVSYKLVLSIRNARQQLVSNITKNNLQWIKTLIVGLIAIIILDSFFSIYEIIFPPIPWNIGTIIAFALIALFSTLGYKGMFQSEILLPNFLLSADSNLRETTRTGSYSSGSPIKQLDAFSEIEIERLKLNLTEILYHKKPYLNESLSLSELANELNITDKKLSELLNQHLNTNFYNLINECRVSEVKKRLADMDNEKYTLLSIAYDCGFPSKTSFNRIFKQKTGMSPSRYKKQIIEES